jgi:hypothetical protein
MAQALGRRYWIQGERAISAWKECANERIGLARLLVYTAGPAPGQTSTLWFPVTSRFWRALQPSLGWGGCYRGLCHFAIRDGRERFPLVSNAALQRTTKRPIKYRNAAHPATSSHAHSYAVSALLAQPWKPHVYDWLVPSTWCSSYPGLRCLTPVPWRRHPGTHVSADPALRTALRVVDSQTCRLLSLPGVR